MPYYPPPPAPPVAPTAAVVTYDKTGRAHITHAQVQGALSDLDAAIGAVSAVPTLGAGGGIMPDAVSPDANGIVAVKTGVSSILPITLLAPVRARGIAVWAGGTAASNGQKNRAVLYSPDGQTILADSGLANSAATTSHVYKIPFAVPYDIVTPGTYLLGVQIGDNANYGVWSPSAGRHSECWAFAGALPATVDPAHNQQGSNDVVVGALY